MFITCPGIRPIPLYHHARRCRLRPFANTCRIVKESALPQQHPPLPVAGTGVMCRMTGAVLHIENTLSRAGSDFRASILEKGKYLNVDLILICAAEARKTSPAGSVVQRACSIPLPPSSSSCETFPFGPADDEPSWHPFAVLRFCLALARNSTRLNYSLSF